jgi:uncharacterized protein (DUF2267 family)
MSNRRYDAQYEPRPGEQAHQQEQRYARFLERLGAAGLGSRERCEAAAVAVLCTLERRISGPEARDLNEELPWALRDLLRRCELHPRARPERFGRGELVARVAEDLEVDEVEAERITREVLSVTRGMLSDKEASDVMAQLPPELHALWAPPA